jgi:hypothetical protein
MGRNSPGKSVQNGIIALLLAKQIGAKATALTVVPPFRTFTDPGTVHVL